MTGNRAKELLSDLMGAVADKFQYDTLFELCNKVGFTEEEMTELGWLDEE